MIRWLLAGLLLGALLSAVDAVASYRRTHPQAAAAGGGHTHHGGGVCEQCLSERIAGSSRFWLGDGSS